MAILTIKKVGNHWYPDINHLAGIDISMTEKIERFLNALSKESSVMSFYLEELVFINDSKDIIYFNEEDITRYFITDDEFNLRFEINNKMFEISSNLYYYITHDLGLNFHINMYKIKINDY